MESKPNLENESVNLNKNEKNVILYLIIEYSVHILIKELKF